MGQKFYTRVFSKDIKKKIIFNKTNLFEYFLMKKVNVIVDSRSFFQKLLRSYCDQFSIRFNKIQHQKLIVRNNVTTYEPITQLEIWFYSIRKCWNCLFLGLFPYSVDDFDSYSNKLCEKSLERIRVSIRNRFFDRNIWNLFDLFHSIIELKRISTIKKKL